MKQVESSVPEFVRQNIDLAQPRLGTRILGCSDEFFASCERMLNPEPAVFIEGKFDEHGKWMDGWETRRRRDTGYDHALIELGEPGIIYGVDIDTSHFTGNYPPAASLEACYSETTPDENSEWITLIPTTEIQGNSHHYLEIETPRVCTHVRLNIFPDGGVARLRLYGRIFCDWDSRDSNELHDVASTKNGGRAIAWNDAHFGQVANLIAPGKGINMGDGWETRRRREPGNDWCIIELGHRATIEEVLVDTAFFKGNYPDSCSIQAADIDKGVRESLITQSMFWHTLLPAQKLSADSEHHFNQVVQDIGPVTHIRFNIIPDGGVSRLRVWGKIV